MTFEVHEIYDVMTVEQCVDLIEAAEDRLNPAQVGDPRSRRVDTSIRKAHNTKFHVDTDETGYIKRHLEHLSQIPIEHAEPVEVVRYMPGGLYQLHYYGDWRAFTLLIYLNDNFEGGTTHFPHVDDDGLRVLPEVGKGVFWANERNLSLHAGDPVLHGEKWIAICHMHFKPYSNFNG